MELIDQSDWDAFRRDPSEETFRDLYEKSKALVWTICLRILRNEEDAGDALQSAYCRLLALAHEPLQGEPEDARQLIYRVTVREANNLRMRRHRRALKEVAVDELPMVAATAPGADELADEAQRREQLARVVDTLPEHYRVPILLHYFDGLTHREVAMVMGKPISTISNRIANAHRKLEGRLRRAGLTGAALLLTTISAKAAPLDPPISLTADAVYREAVISLSTGASNSMALSDLGGRVSSFGARRGAWMNASPASLALLALLGGVATFMMIRELPGISLYLTGGGAPMSAVGETQDADAAFAMDAGSCSAVPLAFEGALGKQTAAN